MIFDSLLCLKTAFDLTAASLTATDSVPLSVIRDVGGGTKLSLHVQFTTAPTTGTASGGWQLWAVTASDAALSANIHVLAASPLFGITHHGGTQPSILHRYQIALPAIMGQVTSAGVNNQNSPRRQAYFGVLLYVPTGALGAGVAAIDLCKDIDSGVIIYPSGAVLGPTGS